MIITLILLLVASLILFLQHPQFGKKPSGARLALIQKSPQFKNGKFENSSATPELAEGYSYFTVISDFLFKKVKRKIPTDLIPSQKTNLLELSIDQDILVWFGHSSYYIQLEGKRFLIDPVFSGNASPVPGTTKSFKGTDIYTVDDLPEIDYLLITHDHYDHLDYKTILKLKPKTKKIICALGVGSHFEFWGFATENIIEKDWHEKIELDQNLTLYTTPSRHFSGRSFKRCNTLWMSFVLETKNFKMYLGGDSGYDTHYAEIGTKFGPFDIALIDNGQYNPAWKYIHNLPEDVIKAMTDIKAKRVFPVHSSKFSLSLHSWDEPLKKVTELNAASANPIPLITPMIGQLVELKNENQKFEQWWNGVE
ncbi:L-ascorbate metabolism protein UlaG (beta-lactamase superfamily) [Flavobacterium araucananum]|jgi:L-ascorbate metabolism protein UlaG (beta-lactamase superfamily)|uniref:MBL fold metallo-hydrolase n=1 Tax=Flavobacterium araucananum TaxID=946678 RepID=A0A227NZB9_9FLAO|nr:MBL fold metallo-hydrolase [Flavobacterium araucananum]OXG02276.1 MBL fold metallo-hydrolase [Flavobacterium araucananum]PWJ98213.1 L-ascorbate metabolism protein UlaG (beta-lactamase superfamily) [Flavobacterium araucananum]